MHRECFQQLTTISDVETKAPIVEEYIHCAKYLRRCIGKQKRRLHGPVLRQKLFSTFRCLPALITTSRGDDDVFLRCDTSILQCAYVLNIATSFQTVSSMNRRGRSRTCTDCSTCVALPVLTVRKTSLACIPPPWILHEIPLHLEALSCFIGLIHA